MVPSPVPANFMYIRPQGSHPILNRMMLGIPRNYSHSIVHFMLFYCSFFFILLFILSHSIVHFMLFYCSFSFILLSFSLILLFILFYSILSLSFYCSFSLILLFFLLHSIVPLLFYDFSLVIFYVFSVDVSRSVSSAPPVEKPCHRCSETKQPQPTSALSNTNKPGSDLDLGKGHKGHMAGACTEAEKGKKSDK